MSSPLQAAMMVRNNGHRLDQCHPDGLRQLVETASLYPLPEYVKEADYNSLRNNTCPLSYCADVRGSGQFPCDSPAATVISYTFFLNKAAELQPKLQALITERFDGLAKNWGIEKDLGTIKAAHVKLSAVENNCTDDDYGIVKVADGTKVRQYPLRNGLEVKNAAHWFAQHLGALRDMYDWGTRKKFAQRILQKAASYELTINPQTRATLEACAADGFQLPSVLAQQLRIRPKLANNVEPEIRQQMSELINLVETHPRRIIAGELAEKIATIMEEFDRTHYLSTKYDNVLLPPEQAVFGVSVKEAEDVLENQCTTLSGAVYAKQAFRLLPLSEVREAFGEEVADSVRVGLHVHPEKMAELAATLLLPDAKLLDALMADAGIQPLEKLAASHVYPTRNDLAALALLGG